MMVAQICLLREIHIKTFSLIDMECFWLFNSVLVIRANIWPFLTIKNFVDDFKYMYSFSILLICWIFTSENWRCNPEITIFLHFFFFFGSCDFYLVSHGKIALGFGISLHRSKDLERVNCLAITLTWDWGSLPIVGTSTLKLLLSEKLPLEWPLD